MSRQVRNIHLYLPGGFIFLFSIVDADDVIQQATAYLHAFYQEDPPPLPQKKSCLLACLFQSCIGKTNKQQMSPTEDKLYFIKWLLICVSWSCSCFDQS